MRNASVSALSGVRRAAGTRKFAGLGSQKRVHRPSAQPGGSVSGRSRACSGVRTRVASCSAWAYRGATGKRGGSAHPARESA